MPISVEQFEQSLSDSGLLSAEEVRAFREQLKPRPENGEDLATALVGERKLTKFQASRIAEGKADGLVFDEYVIVDKIGSGGMGDVFKARHRRMDRLVAVKAISSKAVDSPQAVERFHREVKAAAQLQHQNIVTAFDAREVNGRHYLVMQFVEGQDLSALVKSKGPLEVQQATEFMIQAARGLEYAHKQGIIHRDIKPANLLVDDEGTVKILDMGLARMDQPAADAKDDATEQMELTSTGQVMGTADYMPPEQGVSTHGSDERSDVYSLGCTFYRLLTGQPPFSGETLIAKILAHTNDPIPSLCETRTDIPAELDTVYQKMVAKNPDDRQQSMGEVIEELEAVIAVAVGTPSEPSFRGISVTDISTRPAERPQSMSEVDTTSIHMAESMVEKAVSTPSVIKPKSKRGLLIGGGVALALVLIGVQSLSYWLGPPDKGGPTDVSDATSGEQNTSTSEPTNANVTPVAYDGPNYALKFDGNDCQVAIDSISANKTNGLTMEAWVRPANPIGDLNVVLSLGKHGDDLLVLFETQKWESRVSKRQSITKIVSEQQRNDTQSVHIACCLEGKELRTYVQGEQQGKTIIVDHELPSKSGPFGVGGISTNGVWGHFEGVIDEVRLSSVARYNENFTPAKRHEPDEHTLALYHFDEGQGSTLTDWSGNGHHGTIHNATWVNSDGTPLEAPPKDYALEFDGESSYVETLLSHFGTEPITVEAYISIDRFRHLMKCWTGKVGISLTVDDSNRWVAIPAPVTFGATEGSCTGPVAPLQEFVHVAAVRTKSVRRLYVNGQLVSENNQSVLPREPAQLPGLKLGGVSSNKGQYLDGRMNEFRVSTVERYTKEFTPAERHEPDEHTLALYHFDEGKGDVVIDASGNGHHGKIHGNVKWVAADGALDSADDTAGDGDSLDAGEPGGSGATQPEPTENTSGEDWALEFDGESEQRVTFEPLGVELKSITIEASVLPYSIRISSVIGEWLELRNGPEGVDSSLRWASEAPGKKTKWMVRDKSEPVARIPVHLAAVWYAGDGGSKLFVNGKLVAEHYFEGMDDSISTKNWAIGGFTDSSFWHGLIDEVRISSIARYDKDFTPAKRFEPDEHTVALYHFDEGDGDALKDSSGNGHHGEIEGAKWVKTDGTEIKQSKD